MVKLQNPILFLPDWIIRVLDLPMPISPKLDVQKFIL